MDTQASLEGTLLGLNRQKDALEAEYAKMPSNAGRTIQERKRKAQVEEQLEAVKKQVSAIRIKLRKGGFV